ncbi:MAG: hypothetical protein RLY43_2413, partial [Bacteroidota bacterium]
PSSELISYVNNEWGIEFKYPSNYSVENSFDKNRINVLYPSFVARDGLGSVSIFLTTMDFQNFKDSLNKPEDYSKIIEEKEFVIDNKKGTMLVHTTAIGLDKSVVFIEHEGKNFLINYPNHPVQQEIFNSINFI